jgi:serine/threonine protein kinase
MPYVEGETLRDRLVRERQLPIGEAVRIVQEVAGALAHAHSQGIVHRDVKPENILFMGGHAVVADFGVATAVGRAGGAELTKSGLALGTPVYLASLGHAYARAGMENDARATLARLAQTSTNRHVSAYHVAVIHIALGDTTAGMDCLERAYAEQSPGIGYLAVDPRVDLVRAHPRFASLLRKARLRS